MVRTSQVDNMGESASMSHGGPALEGSAYLQQNSSMGKLKAGSPGQVPAQQASQMPISTTMTPDLSQKFIFFNKEQQNKKRKSLNNTSKEVI